MASGNKVVGETAHLRQLINHIIKVIFLDGSVIQGELKGFDEHMNLLLSDCIEVIKTPQEKRKDIGFIFIRGEQVLATSLVSAPLLTKKEHDLIKEKKKQELDDSIKKKKLDKLKELEKKKKKVLSVKKVEKLPNNETSSKNKTKKINVIARQVEYVTNTKKYFMDNGLTKHYKSIFNLNMNGYLTGQTMSLLQAGSYSLNVIFLYPALLQYFNSLNGTSPTKDFQNSLYAGVSVGFVQGIINVPLENIKLRQIGNRLLSNYPTDFKLTQHPNAFVVSEFFKDDALEERRKILVNKKDDLKNSTSSKNKTHIEQLKKIDKATSLPKNTNVLSYIDLKHRMNIGINGVTTNAEYYNILKHCKKAADAMLQKPALSVFPTIKEMIESGKFDGRNVFLNAWYLVIPISVIETTIFMASLQQLRQYMYEYNSGVEYQDMTFGGKAYTKIKELSYKVPGLYQFAPLFMGVPSAFLTVALTQPLDTLKTVLQSGLAYFGSYVDIGKLYNGATLRFMKLSFIHAGVGFTLSRGVSDHFDSYLEKRKLAV
ncbi:hypothetical protein ACO0OE_000783 [Hanseniaspora uvarum]